MISTCQPTSNSPSPFSNPLVTVSIAPITIGITVTFMFRSFFQFYSKIQVHILLFTFFQFHSVVHWDIKVDNFGNSLFCCCCYLALSQLFRPLEIMSYLVRHKPTKSQSELVTTNTFTIYIYIYIYWFID